MENSEFFTYETKCRRCGRIEEWDSSIKKTKLISEFLAFIRPMLDSPCSYSCETCKKMTVQDVVAF